MLLDIGAKLIVGTAGPPDYPQVELVLAAENGHDDVVQLLDNGAQVNDAGANRSTSLNLATAAACGAIDVLQMLLNEGVEIDVENDDGRTPLFVAVETGNEATVDFSLERGANTNKKDKDGHKPLYFAVWKEHDHRAKLLLDSMTAQ
ncbi:ankyrin repeat-containing domain protein [Truncatella angustata]|uniref:Ankyrin repeat-containing domain protein n=1 Tax=Truncatella angustata TaxID=152316 RepID=A0A9P8UE17_9PEZI|nr:ankyrin repeat-containing domain protein [Truncatella angustata]KAH6648204.1 ankyrin repeat-containing domain protein [Truncatella angustata]